MTAAALVSEVVARLGDTRLLVVANREPYVHVKHVREPGFLGRLRGRKPTTSLSWMQPLVTALDPVMRACGGTWVAHGSGSGDRATSDAHGRVAVPPDDPSKTSTPVLFRHDHHPPEEVGACYRAADVCVVSSLHDGMNLVAEEFIAARTDGQGVLVLSQFTGAARALADVVPVNPFAADEFAAVIDDALRLPVGERQRRMRNLRTEVLSHTVYDWAGTLLSEACRLADVRR